MMLGRRKQCSPIATVADLMTVSRFEPAELAVSCRDAKTAWQVLAQVELLKKV